MRRRVAKTTRFTSALVLAVCVLTAYQKETTGQVPGKQMPFTVEIEVVDSNDKPIGNAPVFVRLESENEDFQKTLNTSEKGLAQIKIAGPGRYLIQVNAKGYKNYGKIWDLGPHQERVVVKLARENEN
ncbi:MAG TPA: hypothetical protein VMU60_01655 [Syntrophobacteria bacterium]|nr:hypothetical protein [Syntrophobacteria bacterium]